MSYESAELAKQTLNAFLALQIAFINEIGSVAKAVGADVDDVSRVLLADRRVSLQAPLHAGKPFDSPCFTRDLEALECLMSPNDPCYPLVLSINPSNAVAR